MASDPLLLADYLFLVLGTQKNLLPLLPDQKTLEKPGESGSRFPATTCYLLGSVFSRRPSQACLFLPPTFFWPFLAFGNVVWTAL